MKLTTKQYQIYSTLSRIEQDLGFTFAIDWITYQVKLRQISSDDCEIALRHLMMAMGD